jgi:hypothetical protein
MKLTPPQRKMLEAIRDQDNTTVTSMPQAARIRRTLFACGLIKWDYDTCTGRVLTEKGVEALK